MCIAPSAQNVLRISTRHDPASLDRFHRLKTALALVLILVGVKMLAASWLKSVLGKNFNLYLLLVVLSILGLDGKGVAKTAHEWVRGIPSDEMMPDLSTLPGTRR